MSLATFEVYRTDNIVQEYLGNVSAKSLKEAKQNASIKYHTKPKLLIVKFK